MICHFRRVINKQGKGKESFPDGSYYKGDFLNGQYEGYAEILYPNGDRYLGMYKDK